MGKITAGPGRRRHGEHWPLPTKQLSTPQTARRPAPTSPRRCASSSSTRPTILGNDAQTRYNALYRGGLRIYTTLDPTIQQAADQAEVAEQLPDTAGRFQAALAAEDAKTGAVRAMVGGAGFDQSQVNLAITPRQTGSAAKLFILLAALQAGVQPNDTIDGTLPCSLPNPGIRRSRSSSTTASSRGVDTVATMTALSINCAYAKLSQIVGLAGWSTPPTGWA